MKNQNIIRPDGRFSPSKSERVEVGKPGSVLQGESFNSMKHGHALAGNFSPEYTVWASMKTRCLNPNTLHYKNYGGRGITVCDRWMQFENFLADMGERPRGMTIHRKDNDKGYFLENCVWATAAEQSRATRANRLITARGKTQCVTDWALELGIPKETLYHRLNKGLSGEDVFKEFSHEQRQERSRKSSAAMWLKHPDRRNPLRQMRKDGTPRVMNWKPKVENP